MALFLAFLCLMGLALVSRSYGQNSQQDYLNAHNAARAQVGVANIVWDTTVATYAQNYANQRIGDCNLVPSGGSYGENLAKGSGSSFTGTAAVNMWAAQKPNYDYTSNTCTGGGVCVNYKQVVWANSTKLGCARVQCTSSWYFVTCNYDVAGNVAGERPY